MIHMMFIVHDDGGEDSNKSVKINVVDVCSKLFTVRENASLQERLLDYETNGVIVCKNCGQVRADFSSSLQINTVCITAEHNSGLAKFSSTRSAL